MVGRPPCEAITSAIAELTGDVNVLCPIDDTNSVESCLPGWTRQTALIHTWTGRIDWDAKAEAGPTIFTKADAPGLSHVPGHLRTELTEALDGRPRIRFLGGELPPRGDHSLVTGLGDVCGVRS